MEITEKGIKSSNSLKDTGIMMISEDAWNNIDTMIREIHRPSPFGIFSFASIIKQSMIFRDIKIKGSDNSNIEIRYIKGLEDNYLDANYPWELLDLHNIIFKNRFPKLVKFDSELRIAEDASELGDLGKVPFGIQEGHTIRSKDNITFIGPCYLDKGIKIGCGTIIERSHIGLNTVIGSNVCVYSSKLENAIVDKGTFIENGIIKNSQIRENSIVRDSYIGDNCILSNNILVSSSTLEKNIKIHSNSTIENCIIMDGTTIFHNCLIVRSIIGKYAMLGVGVNVPCKRLKDVRPVIPEDKKVTYFSETSIIKTENFGAIIGDCCQIGSGGTIHPGRRIGRRSVINAGEQVVHNLHPFSKMPNE